MNAELSDGTILLRAPRRSDVEPALAAIRASIKELTKWTSWCHPDFSRPDLERFLRRIEADRFEDRAYDFYIFSGDTSRVLGGGGLYQIDRTTQCASLGYWVRSDATGQGTATTAARLLARFGFAHLDLERIEIIVAEENVASQRVAEKAGAVREGLLRRRLRLRGRQTDAVGYSLIRDDLHRTG